jgi:hypothetical protein
MKNFHPSQCSTQASGEHYTQEEDCIHNIYGVFSILNLQVGVAGLNPAIGLMLNPQTICNILFAKKAHFTCDGINNTKNSHLWDHDNNPHETIESNYHHF